MQEQINAIKQLFDANNAIAAVIESILVEVIGEKASWENSSLILGLHDAVDLGDIKSKNVPIQVLHMLWRSRIVLNDARTSAEKADLINFLDSVSRDYTEAQLDGRVEEISTRDRCREITNLKAGINMLKQSYKHDLTERDRKISELNTDIVDTANVIAELDGKLEDRDRQIEEFQLTVKNHREQFDNLKSHFEVTLKAIAMNLNALKGERKPDRIEIVGGVETRYRDYINNLTHHQKTLIIEHMQLAIAEEAKKLKGVNLKDFSFDEIPF